MSLIESIRALWQRFTGSRVPEAAETPTLAEEDWDPDSGKVTCRADGHVVDVNGFEYVRYRLTDPYENVRVGYRRVIPTTFLYSCPTCGGMVVGADARRVRPGGSGPLPSAYVCEDCGRREERDFGVPRIEYRESDLTFLEPRGLQPACPQGGAHQWKPVDSWTAIEYPPGVDACTENLIFAEEVEYRSWRCAKCGETREDATIVSSGLSV